MITSGISPSFLGLSQSSGQVTHVLLTRSRLCPGPKPGSSLHLHVLGTPPAFVLSQDQTLREELHRREVKRPAVHKESSKVSASSAVFRTSLGRVALRPHEGRLVHRGLRGIDGVNLGTAVRDGPASGPPGDGVEPGHTLRPRVGRRVRMLLSFQRPSHSSEGVSILRARPEQPKLAPPERTDEYSARSNHCGPGAAG